MEKFIFDFSENGFPLKVEKVKVGETMKCPNIIKFQREMIFIITEKSLLKFAGRYFFTT